MRVFFQLLLCMYDTIDASTDAKYYYHFFKYTKLRNEAHRSMVFCRGSYQVTLCTFYANISSKNDQVQLSPKRANINKNQNPDHMHIFNICTNS